MPHTQRLATTPADHIRARHGNAGAPLESAGRLASLLRTQADGRHAQLLARPVRAASSRDLYWDATVEHSCEALADLSDTDADRLRISAREALAELGVLAGSLQARGGAAARLGELLAAVADEVPADSALYRVDGRPVIVEWGIDVADPPARAPSGAPASALTPPLSAALQGSGQADPIGQDGPPLPDSPKGPAAPSGRRGAGLSYARWSVLAAMAISAGVLGWRAATPLPANEVERTREAPGLDDEIAAESKRRDTLRERLSTLGAQRDELLQVCEAPLPEPEPEPEPTPEPEFEPEPKVADVEPPPAPKPPPPVAKAPPPAKHPKPGESRPATEYCPADKIISPEIVLVYDNSGSMAVPLNMPEEDASRAFARYNLERAQHLKRSAVAGVVGALEQITGRRRTVRRPPPFPSVEQWARQNLGGAFQRYGEQRSVIARKVTKRLISRAPADAELQLIAFSGCDKIAAFDAGRDPGRRRQLLGIVDKLSPSEGTPVAASLREAAKRIDGTRKEAAAIIILLTDGEEACQGNPCAAAAAIRRAKPFSTVHVVRLGSSSVAACAAQATGGKFYQPTSVNALTAALEEARVTSPFEIGCRK